jgi:hypothetical protein
LALEDIHDCYQGKTEIDGLKDHVSLAYVIWSLLERSRIYYVFISSRTMGPWLVPFMLVNPLIHFGGIRGEKNLCSLASPHYN